MNGFVIAKPKKDATTANAEDDYVSTKDPILKVFKVDQGTVSFGNELNTTKDIPIPHPFSYKPFIQVYAERIPGLNLSLVQSTNQVATGELVAVVSFVQDSTFTIRFISLSSDPTGIYRYLYYIFLDDAEQK